MKKKTAALSLLAVAGITGFWIAQAGNLEPLGSPAPTMHTLDEIYNLLLIQGNSVPRYQSWVKDGGWPTVAVLETIHIGSGVVHSLVFSNPAQGWYRFEIFDDTTLIGVYEHNSFGDRGQHAVFPLDIAFNTSLEIQYVNISQFDANVSVVVTYLPD